MRISKDTRPDIDLSLPITIKSDPNSCFGNEWAPLDYECGICSVSDLCSSIYKVNKVDPLTQEVQDREGPFLDEVSFEAVDWNNVARIIRKKKHYPYIKVISHVSKHAKCKDLDSVKAQVKMFMEREGFTHMNDSILG